MDENTTLKILTSKDKTIGGAVVAAMFYFLASINGNTSAQNDNLEKLIIAVDKRVTVLETKHEIERGR